MPDFERPEGNNKYKKRPLWQWIALYLVIGAALYFLIYSLWLGRGY
jgi:hypothetical protein